MKARTCGELRRSGGFTLIEVLVVISIILFLMAFIIAVVGRHSEDAKITATRALISRVSMALDRYYADNRAYPRVNATAMMANVYMVIGQYEGFNAGELKTVGATAGTGVKPMPNPMSPTFDGQSCVVDPWGMPIIYWSTTPERAVIGSYMLYSYGPDQEYGGGDDISLKKAVY